MKSIEYNILLIITGSHDQVNGYILLSQLLLLFSCPFIVVHIITSNRYIEQLRQPFFTV